MMRYRAIHSRAACKQAQQRAGAVAQGCTALRR
jgi:hypothetical protein